MTQSRAVWPESAIVGTTPVGSPPAQRRMVAAAPDAADGGDRRDSGLEAVLLTAAAPRLRDSGVLEPERAIGLLEEIARFVADDHPPDGVDAGQVANVVAMLEQEIAKYRSLHRLDDEPIKA